MTTSNNMFPSWSPNPAFPENAEFPNKGSEAINIGDLLYWDSSNNCVRSFSNYADQGSAAAQQAALAPLFMGVAASAALSTESTTRAVRIWTDIILEMPCDSGTFAIGDYVGVSYSTGARNQQVAGVGNAAALAIGRVVKRYASAATKVKCRLMSRYLNGFNAMAGLNAYGLLPVATIAATGSAQGDAATLTGQFNLVTGADATKGVILPTATPGMTVEVKNSDAANAILKVYPATGGTINALSANAAISLAAKVPAIFRALSATAWYTIPLLPS
jgi:hypothetical protein